MASERSKQSLTATNPPPRALDVQKFAESRAPELESLLSIVTNRVNNDFRSRRNKRRRTTGYDNRVAKNRGKKRRKVEEIKKNEGLVLEKDQKKVSRRIRRRMEFKKNPELGFCTSGDGTKRLRTHLWHAKRFMMVKRWGFHLPLGLQGRGKGSRAVLKWLKYGSLVHDASYCCAVQLEGPEDSLLTILGMVLVPSPAVIPEGQFCPLFCGVCYGSATLHHIGAPVSKLIAPVTYMWRPCFRDQLNVDCGEDPILNGFHMACNNECSTSLRQLWIWIHAAAFSEGFDALKSACQKLMHENGVSVNCFSLDGKFARLEVMGSKATQVIQKILHPISETPSAFEHPMLRKCSIVDSDTNYQHQKAFVLKHAQDLPSRAILSLVVQDPRDLSMNSIDCVLEAPSTSFGADLQKVDDVKENATVAPNNNEEVMSSLWLKPDGNTGHFSDSKDLWASQEQISPPVEENVLCTERHQRRLDSFFLASTSSQTLPAETKEGSVRSCPILLLKNSNRCDSCMGWSIILPVSWVKAFWIPLISHGARAVGLRERRWVASDNGVPLFPFDFPDCKAYSSLMAAEAAASNQIAELRPLAMRPLRVPIPPPWDCARCFVEEESTTTSMGDIKMLDAQINSAEIARGTLSVNSDRGNYDSASLEQKDGSTFQGFVARTSCIISKHLSTVHGDHLLLFPNTSMGEKGFYEMMKKGRICWLPKRENQIQPDQRPCFLRVLLHAYKEGVFEEGAVVCAPFLSDVLLWKSRSEEEQDGLQIPQSLLKSYFIQQQSGKWELQIPGDPLIRQQSHRRPIGFVTTGFVRGSTKPVATALCEVTSLAQLRKEQWSEMQEKGRREIFVLVRNLKSTAYRLGLATIVVEQQEEDLAAM
ncbi:ribonuclease Ps isoform X2 [Tasmannia lanceolata]|uniref:ribonuclease Ps isoform X2 n=1 Tax=Tasmannia lanceolata TaxID=3420 RepID=UPI0040632FEA